MCLKLVKKYKNMLKKMVFLLLEITAVTDPELRIPMERALVNLGILLIKNRSDFRAGRELTDLFERML